MNVLRRIGRAFGVIGRGLMRAVTVAAASGLDDDLFDLAVGFVTKANVRFASTDERREWALEQLRAHGVKESIGRLAIEMAVQAYKAKIGAYK